MAWYSDWQYRKKLTVDYTKVSASETDFVVVVKLASDANLASYAQASGNDILITSSDEVTKLSHALLSYDNVTGELYLIFKAPSLSSTVDTDFYLYFGKAGASAQEDPTAVFPTNFKGVWPLNESSGTRYDLTSNNNDLTDATSGVSGVTGKLDTGAQVERANNEYLYITDANQTGLDITGDLSYATWLNYQSLPQNGVITGIMGRWNTGSSSNWSYGLFDYYTGTNYLIGTFSSENGTSNNNQNTAVSISSDTWYRVVAVVDISVPETKIYVNGSYVGNSTNGTQTSLFYDGNLDFRIGNFYDTAFLDATLEYASLYNGIHDADYIATEYNNQNSPSTFYTLATLEENNTSTATVLPVTLTLTPTTTTPTYLSIETATVTPLTTTLTIVDPTATYIQINTATVNPVALTLSTTITTATSVGQQENYTRESSVSLPTDDTDLSTSYNSTDLTNVESDNDVRVDLTGSNYLLHQFKYTHTNNTDPFSVTSNVRSTKAPSTNTVYLQVYNRNTTSWETLATNNSANADTDFDMQGSKNSNLSNYYDGSNVLSFRVYQQV